MNPGSCCDSSFCGGASTTPAVNSLSKFNCNTVLWGRKKTFLLIMPICHLQQWGYFFFFFFLIFLNQKAGMGMVCVQCHVCSETGARPLFKQAYLSLTHSHAHMHTFPSMYCSNRSACKNSIISARKWDTLHLALQSDKHTKNFISKCLNSLVSPHEK